MSSLGVGFSKKEIQLHKGMSGLKYYLIVLYLRFHLEPVNRVNTTLADIMNECGYSSNSHNASIYDDWRAILKDLISQEYITCSQDIMNVSPSKQLHIIFNYKKNLFFTNDSFVFITKHEFDTISSYRTKMNKSVITLYTS